MKICKTTYELYGVKLNAQNVLLSHKYTHRDVCTTHLKTMSDINQVMLQFINITNLVDPLLHNLYSTRFRSVLLVGKRWQRSGEMNAGVSRSRRLIVSCSVRFVGGLGEVNPPLVEDDPLTGDCKVWSGGRIRLPHSTPQQGKNMNSSYDDVYIPHVFSSLHTTDHRRSQSAGAGAGCNCPRET